VKGRIPTTLRIYSRKAETFFIDKMWDRHWSDSDEIAHRIKARKAFVVDDERPGTAAQKWSSAVKRLIDGPSRFQVLLGEEKDIYEVVPNTPITDLRIYDIEQRGNGGRAWKVTTPDGYSYDMREDVFIEALCEVGLKEPGVLAGEYVWAVLGSQTRLVRVGSELHKILAEKTQTKVVKAKVKVKSIKTSELVAGGIYSTQGGTPYLYLGAFRASSDPKKNHMWLSLSNTTELDVERAILNLGTYYGTYAISWVKSKAVHTLEGTVSAETVARALEAVRQCGNRQMERYQDTRGRLTMSPASLRHYWDRIVESEGWRVSFTPYGEDVRPVDQWASLRYPFGEGAR
jgi:hypothetical protein